MIRKVEEYCKAILMSMECVRFPFHNLAHTQDVVGNSEVISRALHLANEEIELIKLAAWFHDTGYSIGYSNHEASSKQIAQQFLANENMSKEKNDFICSLIEATKMPQSPKNIYEKVLCDADLFHIGTNDFFFRKLLLRREWEQYQTVILSDLEWYKLNLEFLKNHQFETKFGKNILEKGKQKNISKIEEIIGYYQM